MVDRHGHRVEVIEVDGREVFKVRAAGGGHVPCWVGGRLLKHPAKPEHLAAMGVDLGSLVLSD